MQKKILSPIQMRRGLDTHQELIIWARKLVDVHEKFIATVANLDHIISKKVGPPGAKPTKREVTDAVYALLPAKEQIVAMLKPHIPASEPSLTRDDVVRIFHESFNAFKSTLAPENKSRYLGEDDIPMLLERVSRIMPKSSKEQKEIDPLAIFDAISKIPDGKRIPLRLVDGLEQTLSALRNQTKHGYLHGAGITALTAGANITLTKDANGNYTISSTGGGSANLLSETPQGLIDGVNTVYTVSSSIQLPVAFGIGPAVIEPEQYTFSGTTITFNQPLDLSLAGLPFNFVYVSGSAPANALILTEGGDNLSTEAGDNLATE